MDMADGGIAEVYQGGSDGRSVLLVSPHLDDAALSCEAIVGGSFSVDVLTVFAGRPALAGSYAWDAFCGFADSDQAMDARLAEDDAAFADTPHRLHRLALRDSQYLDGPRSRVEAQELCGWIDAWVDAQSRPTTVFLPVGAGLRLSPALVLAKRMVGPRARAVLHRWRQRQDPARFGPVVGEDHLWVRDVLTAHLAARGVALAFYEEFPYLLARRGDQEALACAARHGLSARAVEVPVDTAHKRKRIAHYASQGPQLIGVAESAADGGSAVSTERYWCLASAAAGASGRAARRNLSVASMRA